jgi:hypothetical protein
MHILAKEYDMTVPIKVPIPQGFPLSTRASNGEIEQIAKKIANPELHQPPSILMRRDAGGGVTVIQGTMRLRASLETTGEARARDIDTGETLVLRLNGHAIDVFVADDLATSQAPEKKRGARPR